MTRFLIPLAFSLALAGCAQKQTKPVPYLPEDGEDAPAATKTETTPTADEETPEGEIDLGIEGEYKSVDVEASPDDEGEGSMPSIADKSCDEPADCKGDPNLDAMGTWGCDENRCIYTPKINVDSFKPKK